MSVREFQAKRPAESIAAIAALRQGADREPAPPDIICAYAGRAGAEAIAGLPSAEPFRALFGVLAPGDSLSVTLASGASVDLPVAVTVRLAADRQTPRAQRAGTIARMMDAALLATYPGLIFTSVTPPPAQRDRFCHLEVLQPEPRGLTELQARALREAPQPRAIASAGSQDDRPARPGSVAPLAVSGTALSVVLQCLSTRAVLRYELVPEELSAPQLRQIAAIEQGLVSDLQRPDDPLVDGHAAESLIRMRILTRARTALRLRVTVSSEAPLIDTELDLISTAIFGVPRAAMSGDETCVASLLPRDVGALILERLVTASVAAMLDLERHSRSGPAEGTLLGYSARGLEVRHPLPDRSQHTYVLGATGTGKSTLLEKILCQDIESGSGVILIDVHGDLFEAVRRSVPERRRGDLVLAHAGDARFPFTLNVLAGNSGDPDFDRNAVTNDLIEIFRRTLYRGVPEAFGPMFEVYFRNAMLLLMSAQGDAATILDFERVFQDDAFRARLLSACPLPHIVAFWRGIADRVTNHEISIESLAPYIVCKLTQITTNERLRPILGATTSSLDFEQIITGRQICLVNLDKARLGERSAAFLGGVVLSRLCMAALAQGRRPPAERTPATIVLDEFQSYATDSLPSMLAETRKFGFRVTLANQTVSQIDGRGLNPNVLGPILGNVANLVAFRVGVEDANAVGGWFAPGIGLDALVRLPNFHAVVRLLQAGEPAAPVQIRTLPSVSGL